MIRILNYHCILNNGNLQSRSQTLPGPFKKKKKKNEQGRVWHVSIYSAEADTTRIEPDLTNIGTFLSENEPDYPQDGSNELCDTFPA